VGLLEVQQRRSVSDASVQYRPAIDGLRAIAVLSVFFFHLQRKWLPGGFVGVDVLFVISGFLITSILLRDFERNTFSLWKFYQRRIARLFPAFYAVALATIAAAMLLFNPQDLASAGTALSSASLFIANLKYMVQGNYFKISPDQQPFLHCWSLSVEEQFYMIFPTLLAILYLKAARRLTAILVNGLSRYTRRLVLLTEPPFLPESAGREAMKNGARPPFWEDPARRARRIPVNELVKRLQHGNVTVIDVAPLFTMSDGSVRIFGDDGTLLYQDPRHLSVAGANLVKPYLLRAIEN
jgi:hypothetical protein